MDGGRVTAVEKSSVESKTFSRQGISNGKVQMILNSLLEILLATRFLGLGPRLLDSELSTFDSRLFQQCAQLAHPLLRGVAILEDTDSRNAGGPGFQAWADTLHGDSPQRQDRYGYLRGYLP